MRQYARLLRDNPDYARLWLAGVISFLGDWFDTIALSTLVVAYSADNKGLAVSALLMARFIPPMLISPFAGVLIDRFDRKRLLIWSNYLRSGVVLLLLLGTRGPDWMWLIYVLTIAQASLSAVFTPGESALIPSLVKRDDLVRANTLGSVTWSVMLAVGAALGGIASSLFGTSFALIFDAFTFIVAGWLISQIKSYQFQAVATQPHEPRSDTSFREGLRFLRRNPGTAVTLLIKFGASLGNIDTLMTIFATQVFVLGNGGQLSLGIMYSAFGVGAILGPVLLNRFNDGSVRVMRRLVVIGFVWVVVGWLILGIAGSLVVVCIALFFRAMGGSVNWTYSSVMIQKLVPDAYLGRVFSTDLGLYYLATVTSTVLHGSLVDALGSANLPLIAFGTMGISLFPLVLWTLATRVMERRAPAAVVHT
ncbi:MAG: MFS transporter [Anaerolineae bacterium]|nr:MFS transporter [Anaerolineae bacterium]